MKMPAKVRNSWFVIALAVLYFAPSSFGLASVHAANKPEKRCKVGDCKVAVAEGGNAGLYLLIAGATCLGALGLRSRQAHKLKSDVQ